MTEELLAQVVEEVSILAAEYRRKEPRTLKRPGAVGRAQAQAKQSDHGGLLTAAMAGRVRRG